MSNQDNEYPVVGRDPDIDLTEYSATVLGRTIVDYEKLKQHEPDLYGRIVENERESNRLIDSE